MKLSEVKVAANGDHVMLKHGFYLERSKNNVGNASMWRVFRVMDEDLYGLAWVTPRFPNQTEWTDVAFHFSTSGGKDAPITSSIFRALSKKNAEEHLAKWVESEILPKHYNHLLEDVFSDLRKAKAQKRKSEKDIWLVRLNKDGSESRMHDAKKYFDTYEEAVEHHNRMVKNNPGKLIAHMLYADSLILVKRKLEGEVRP